MAKKINFLLYEKADYDLLDELGEIINGSHPHRSLHRLFDPYLHPRGIKEMAARRELRLVYAMLKLLDSNDFSSDAIERRLSALKSLRDEVLEGNPSSLRLNTARVVLQIMKLLIRSAGDPPRQLQLAHELRMALLGQPRFIRRQLRRYHLLEMPEEWNQITFDDHVHDANTKGRKTPTHLIMDAWIKGIRRLQVIYYNFVPSLAARELLTAAETMGVEVRIGVEFSTVSRGKFVETIWTPEGFSSAGHFLAFLDKEEVRIFSMCCSEASEWCRQRILEQFRKFNEEYRLTLNERFNVECPVQQQEEFLKTAGCGQLSLLHLSEFICGVYSALLHRRCESQDDSEETTEALALLSPEFINDNYLDSRVIHQPPTDLSTLPEMMLLPQSELSERLYGLSSSCRLSLSLRGLTKADVIEMIYDCSGRITHLEMFNLKEFKADATQDWEEINQFRHAVNCGNVIRLKRIIRSTIADLEKIHGGECVEQVRKLHEVLANIPALIGFYAQSPLGARMGSDSTGRYRHLHGMGLTVVESLSWSVRRRILSGRDPNREIIPVTAMVSGWTRYQPIAYHWGWLNGLALAWRRIGSPFGLGCRKEKEWQVGDKAEIIGTPGNIATLGGYWDEPVHEGLEFLPRNSWDDYWNCLNSNLKIAIKVLIGFLPAFLTFYYTQSWWLLIYGGALIWLGITGVRNIIQAVLGGGGWKRSDLLKWNDFISWQRIADSLMYTGISVPLLELGVRILLLEKWLGLNASNSPVLVYSVIAVVNGFYISGHNILRGLPKGSASGNFFRAVLSTPLAIIFSIALSALLGALGIAGISAIVQQWSTIISKAASDCVAGVIEGCADRGRNIRLRLLDYQVKLAQLFSAYSRLEVLYPESDVLEMLKSPKTLVKNIAAEQQELERIMIINALDLLYFQMYQAQGYNALLVQMDNLTPEERTILLRSQYILKREKECSQMFIDGLIGKNFARALAFYLDYHLAYLERLEQMSAKFECFAEKMPPTVRSA